MKLTLILKGNITRRGHFEKSLATLRNALPGAYISLLETRRAGQAVELAARACVESDYLIAVGGDGTVNEVVNGCLRAQEQSPAITLPALGILAYGSANDLARSLGLRGEVGELIHLLLSQSTARIDAGRLYYTDADGTQAQRYFLNAADIGVGARTVEYLNRRPRLLGSNLHYLRSVLSTLATYRPQEVHAVSDHGLDWCGKSLAVVAANGRYLGSGLCVAPGARLDDGLLAITLVGEADAADFLRNLGYLRRGELLNHPAAHYHHAARLEIEHGGQPVPVEVDGEFLGHTPACVEVIPAAVEILHPGLEASA
ncbi:diacylglycerol/lipid kinase family protein [Mangrovimicrobium sediminis]|uniref:diacylglycerol/lipid kinase family protein n=1 Tax=Mangrovimicrobium sediminis TaxID=2562682 RepID=UPI0014366E63|nr:YegS/Rv2252/BmrU family lipid kinase [Haliea sp. SAOS-164]